MGHFEENGQRSTGGEKSLNSKMAFWLWMLLIDNIQET